VPPYLTVPEAAEYARASRQRIYDLLSAGRLTDTRTAGAPSCSALSSIPTSPDSRGRVAPESRRAQARKPRTGRVFCAPGWWPTRSASANTRRARCQTVATGRTASARGLREPETPP